MREPIAGLFTLLLAAPASAAFRSAPVAPLLAPLGLPGAGLTAPRIASPFSPTAFPAVSALPSFRPALALPNAALPAPAVNAAAQAAPFAGKPIAAFLASRVEAIAEAGGAQAAPAQARVELDRLFSGGTPSGQPSVANAVSERKVVNAEGVGIFGRAPAYYHEAMRLVEKYKDRVDFSESLDVMDDSYGDAWAKLAAVEALARRRQVEDHNTHLDGTLLWVDGVLNDRGRQVAVNTYRVYFHRAENPRSEIAEGLRRTDGYLKQALDYFRPGGKAERALGRLHEVVLTFDTRGYAEIKEALKAKEAEVSRATKGRVRFAYLDELVDMPKDAQETRTRLNALVQRYGRMEGLGKIIEGVVYGRYVGMLLELKTIEHYLLKGYEVLQSGRELFDEAGMYVTELDTVVRDPRTGRVSLVEAKSARVPIPFSEALQEKVVRKLETYKRQRALLERAAGARIDEVVFSFDVGNNVGLKPYLQAREKELSERYGFAVRFLFLESGPERPAERPRGKGRRR